MKGENHMSYSSGEIFTHGPTINRSNINFAGNVRTSGVHAVQKVWDMTVPRTDRAIELQQRMEALTALRDKFPLPNIADLVADAEPDEWETIIRDNTEAYVQSHMAGVAYDWSMNRTRIALRGERDAAVQFTTVMSHLNIDEVTEQFQEAVTTLGGAAESTETAADADPNALASLREAGRKLLILTNIMPSIQILEGRSQVRTAALFLNLDDLPELQQYRVNGERVNVHTTEDAEAHDIAQAAVMQAQADPSLFLIRAALGAYQGMTFDVARTTEEFERRALILDGTGDVRNVPYTPELARRMQENQ